MAFAIILSVSAQEKTKQKELGLGLQNLDKFALIYKFGHQKSMWRLMGVYGNFNSLTSEIDDKEDEQNKQTSSTFGISFGKQFHSHINDDFKFIYGADLNFSYSSYKIIEQGSEYDYEKKHTVYVPGFDILLGFNYDLNESFVIGLELLPGISYISRETKNENTRGGAESFTESKKGFSIGASTSSALLTLAYRFGKNSE